MCVYVCARMCVCVFSTLTMFSSDDWHLTADVTSDTFPSCPTASTITGSDTSSLVKIAVFMMVSLCKVTEQDIHLSRLHQRKSTCRATPCL